MLFRLAKCHDLREKSTSESSIQSICSIESKALALAFNALVELLCKSPVLQTTSSFAIVTTPMKQDGRGSFRRGFCNLYKALNDRRIDMLGEMLLDFVTYSIGKF